MEFLKVCQMQHMHKTTVARIGLLRAAGVLLIQILQAQRFGGGNFIEFQ